MEWALEEQAVCYLRTFIRKVLPPHSQSEICRYQSSNKLFSHLSWLDTFCHFVKWNRSHAPSLTVLKSNQFPKSPVTLKMTSLRASCFSSLDTPILWVPYQTRHWETCDSCHFVHFYLESSTRVFPNLWFTKFIRGYFNHRWLHPRLQPSTDGGAERPFSVPYWGFWSPRFPLSPPSCSALSPFLRLSKLSVFLLWFIVYSSRVLMSWILDFWNPKAFSLKVLPLPYIPKIYSEAQNPKINSLKFCSITTKTPTLRH